MRHQRGAISVDILGGLLVVLSVMAIAWAFMHEDTDARFNKQAADHIATVVGAADRWIQKNQSAVAAAAAPLATYTLTNIASELPSSFSGTNVYGHGYSIRVYKNAAGALEWLVLTTGGQTLDNKNVRKLAGMIGGMGGYIDSATPTIVKGVFGGWSVPIATYGASPGPGHVAAAGFLASSGLVDLYVYRNAVAGHPEYNTMNTPLIMAAVNTVNGACSTLGAISRDVAGKVLTCDGANWRSQGSAYWEDPVANYASLPTCNASSAWQTRVVQTPTVGTGPRAYTCNGTAWQALAVDNNGNLTVSGSLVVGSAMGVGVTTVSSVGAACASGAVSQTATGTVLYCDTNTLTYRAASAGEAVANTVQITGVFVEGTACPNGTADNGRVGRDANGLILSCQSGVWRKAGSKSLGVRVAMALGANFVAPSDGFVAASAQCSVAWASITATIVTTGHWVRSAATGGGSTTAPSVTLPVREGETVVVTASPGATCASTLVWFSPLS